NALQRRMSQPTGAPEDSPKSGHSPVIDVRESSLVLVPRVSVEQVGCRPQFCNKNDLTVAGLKINLSASVDGTGLIQSGRGTGPMTPRQPVAARSAMTRCQFQLKRLAWER